MSVTQSTIFRVRYIVHVHFSTFRFSSQVMTDKQSYDLSSSSSSSFITQEAAQKKYTHKNIKT